MSYVRETRVAGQSKFNLIRITRFQFRDSRVSAQHLLRLWHVCGLLASLLSVVFATFIVVRVLVYGIDVPGYASLMTVVLFLGGLH